MSDGDSRGVLSLFLLRNFWRLVGLALGLGLGLCWACFGATKTLVILLVGLLGFYTGKWLDDGRPGGGLIKHFKNFFD